MVYIIICTVTPRDKDNPVCAKSLHHVTCKIHNLRHLSWIVIYMWVILHTINLLLQIKQITVYVAMWLSISRVVYFVRVVVICVDSRDFNIVQWTANKANNTSAIWWISFSLNLLLVIIAVAANSTIFFIPSIIITMVVMMLIRIGIIEKITFMQWREWTILIENFSELGYL